MADFNIDGRMKVKTLKAQFKEAFGATLRVYKGPGFADDNATLASIRAEGAKGGEVKVVGNMKVGNMKVGNFEDKIKEVFGIKVQVATKDDSALADNGLTLSAAGK